MSSFTPTERTRLRRLPDRGRFDRETVYLILDEGFICHLGFVSEGKPIVIPTLFGRDGDRLYVHGSAVGRTQRTLAQGLDCCLTVTLVDGLVLARSGFHSSMNYRSVVVLGRAKPVEDPQEKTRGLAVISEHLLPGRWAEVRVPSEKELKITSVLAIDLNEVSAKVRTGGPKDDEEDYDLNVWAGVLPVELQFGEPVADEKLRNGIAEPVYVRERIGKGRRRKCPAPSSQLQDGNSHQSKHNS